MRISPAKLLIFILVLCQLGVGVAWAAPPEPTVHVVERGETLFRIALRYGTSVEALVRANRIADPNLIRVGQRLIIPSPDAMAEGAMPAQPRIHIVRAGETLFRIALRYGTSVEALVRANRIADPSLIYVGQRLVIPGQADIWPAPFASIELVPSPVIQGQTLAIKVRANEDVVLAGSFDGRPLTFVEGDGCRWALVGIHVRTPPGPYLLELTASDEAGEATQVTTIVQVAAGRFLTEHIRLPPGAKKLLDPSLIRAENERLAAVFAAFSPQKRWDGPFALPVEGAITSRFGARRAYDGGPATGYHEGVDFRAAEGTPIRAAAAGRVALAEALTVRGQAVVLDHGLGIMSGYYHLSEIAVQTGQEVKRGALIGKAGSTGLSTGAHLHWEVRVHGVLVDPLQWTWQAIP